MTHATVAGNRSETVFGETVDKATTMWKIDLASSP
jgi:hypothetical protein